MPFQIACIVEGHGEMEAAPVLIRRIAQEIDPTRVVRMPTPIRVPRQRVVKAGELERAVELAANKVGGSGGAILVLLDSEGECPARLGPRLLRQAVQSRGDLPIGVVLAHQEFETWFLAAAHSLRGQRGLSTAMEPPPQPEAVRGAKEWLTRHIQGSRRYVETLDQPALTAQLELAVARGIDSFDKCYREITRLLVL